MNDEMMSVLEAQLELCKTALHREHEAIHKANRVEDRWDALENWVMAMKEVSYLDINCLNATLEKMQELKREMNDERTTI